MSPDLNDEESWFPWHLGISDAHCHPTDTMSSVSKITTMKTNALVLMSTRAEDQALVSHCTQLYSGDVDDETSDHQNALLIPSFGWHPWFAHLLFDNNSEDTAEPLTGAAKLNHYSAVLHPKPADENFINSLPDPTPLSGFISQTRGYLEKHPLALVGEVGLDRSFRLPAAWTPEEKGKRDDSLTAGGREGRRLTKHKVTLEHQRKILSAQLQLAAEMQRPVSIHGVSAHGTLFECIKETWKSLGEKHKHLRTTVSRTITLSTQENSDNDALECQDYKPHSPRICLHSYSGDSQMIKQYLHSSVPVDVYFSFSMTINFSNLSMKTEAAVRAIPDKRILVESDLHKAGEVMEERLEQVIRKVCDIKGWSLDYGVLLLHQNWKCFIYGDK